jgi:hypothetical protein
MAGGGGGGGYSATGGGGGAAASGDGPKGCQPAHAETSKANVKTAATVA